MLVSQELLFLGFTENESKVYNTLYRMGPSLASTLARLCRVNRSSVYDLLNGLLERNLIISYKRGIYSYYAIDDVRKLYYQETQRVRMAKTFIEKLSQSPEDFNAMRVNYYTGQEGYRQLYEEILRQKPVEIMAWIHLDNFCKALDVKREMEWTKERIDAGIFARYILNDSKLTRAAKLKDAASKRESRLVPEEFLFFSTCFLYENHVVFFDSSTEVIGIRINHLGFFNLQKQIFEMHWRVLA